MIFDYHDWKLKLLHNFPPYLNYIAAKTLRNISINILSLAFLPHIHDMHTHTHTTVLQPFFRDHPVEPLPDENFWTLWCKGRSTETHTHNPAGRQSIRTNQCPPPPSPIMTRTKCTLYILAH